jgi:hypothetical protein
MVLGLAQQIETRNYTSWTLQSLTIEWLKHQWASPPLTATLRSSIPSLRTVSESASSGCRFGWNSPDFLHIRDL